MTVFVVQQQVKYDPDKRELVPRFPSISKAEKWGELVFILRPDAHPLESEAVLGDIHMKLLDFCDNDHLLLIGNPGLIGMSTAVAAHYNDGSVKFLQWSGRHGEYTEVITKIF